MYLLELIQVSSQFMIVCCMTKIQEIPVVKTSFIGSLHGLKAKLKSTVSTNQKHNKNFLGVA